MRKLALLLLFGSTALHGQTGAKPSPSTSPEHVLWYRAPAATWNEALPIGNGRLGAMVFGGVTDERLQLNEDSVWAGQKLDRVNPAAAKAIPEIRRLLAAGKPAEAEALADETVISIPRRMPPYQTLGNLQLRFEGGPPFSAYRRELDIDQAVTRVTFRAGGTTFTREVFASAIDQVIVMRITSDQPGKITFSATMTRELDAAARTEGQDTVLLEGQAFPPKNERHAAEPRAGVRFVGMTRAVADGGRVSATGDALSVKGADAVTLFIAAATNMREKDPAAACRVVLNDAAAAKPLDRLRATTSGTISAFSAESSSASTAHRRVSQPTSVSRA